MSVTFVVPVWREDVYQRVSRPWLLHQVERYGAELIESRGASSIFEALEYGRQRAKHDLVCYVHDDVRLLSPMDLTERIAVAFAMYPGLGVLGPVGKLERARVPWWTNSGNYVGHWFRRGVHGQLVYQMGDNRGRAPFVNVTGDPAVFWERHRPRWDSFAIAGLVDGFILMESRSRMIVPWDTETYGPQWHGYDVDRCFQAHSLSLDVMVSPWLFLHDNAGHAGYRGSDRAALSADRRDQENRQIKSAGDALWLADLDAVNGMVRRKWGLA